MKSTATYAIYYDAEFTSIDDLSKAGLISAGFVSEKDDRQFYAELLDTWEPVMCSFFVLDTVLPLLEDGEQAVMKGRQMKVAEFARQLKTWIESFDGQVVLKSDAPSADFPFLVKIFDVHGWPFNLRRKCSFVWFDRQDQQFRYQQALADFWKTHGKQQHHALIDARSMQYASKFAIRRGMNDGYRR